LPSPKSHIQLNGVFVIKPEKLTVNGVDPIIRETFIDDAGNVVDIYIIIILLF
jgi:hypothetical protein